jgi:hypothetical protein
MKSGMSTGTTVRHFDSILGGGNRAVRSASQKKVDPMSVATLPQPRCESVSMRARHSGMHTFPCLENPSMQVQSLPE